MYIISENPTVDDELSLVCQATLPNSDCFLENFTVDIENGIIIINANYSMGIWHTVCSSLDTINIGTILNAGEYELYYNYDVNNKGEVNIDTLRFSVLDINSTTDQKKEKYLVSNIITNEIQLRNIEDIINVSLYDSKGKLEKVYENVNNRLDVSEVHRGVYFLHLEFKDNIKIQKIIIY